MKPLSRKIIKQSRCVFTGKIFFENLERHFLYEVKKLWIPDKKNPLMDILIHEIVESLSPEEQLAFREEHRRSVPLKEFSAQTIKIFYRQKSQEKIQELEEEFQKACKTILNMRKRRSILYVLFKFLQNKRSI